MMRQTEKLTHTCTHTHSHTHTHTHTHTPAHQFLCCSACYIISGPDLFRISINTHEKTHTHANTRTHRPLHAEKIHRFARINHTNTHRLAPKGALHHPNDSRPPKSAPRSQTSCLLSYQMKWSGLGNEVALKDFSVLPWCSCVDFHPGDENETFWSSSASCIFCCHSQVVCSSSSKKALTHQSDIKAQLLPHVSRVPAKKLHLNTSQRLQLTATVLLRSAPGWKEMPLCRCTNRCCD